MSRHAIRGWLFAVGTAGALAFGGAQAAATPSAARDAVEARKCNPTSCDRKCRAQGGISGRCTDAGLCLCLF